MEGTTKVIGKQRCSTVDMSVSVLLDLFHFQDHRSKPQKYKTITYYNNGSD